MNSRPDLPSRRGLVLTAAFLLTVGCQRAPVGSPPPAPADEAPPAARVAVVRPKGGVIRREVSQPGAVEAFEETPVFAKVSGYVKEGWKDIGARPGKGDTLAELWAPELEDELRQQEALVEQAGAEVAQARAAEKAAGAAYASAVAQVEVAEAGRRILLARQERTRKQHARLERVGSAVLDREQVEEAQLGFETARAGVAEADAKIKAAQALREEAGARRDKARADVRAAEARRAVAEHGRDVARDQVRYLRLAAPFAGVVTQRHVKTGDFVRAAAAGAGKPLYVVHRTDLLRLVLEVPEADAVWVREGVEARIRVQVLPGRTFTGRVARTSSSLDPTAHTLRAEIDLAGGDGPLRPGMYAHVTLTAEQSARWTLPRSAVRTEGDVTRGYQSFGYQVEGGRARRLLVELGAGDGERVEVLRKRAPGGGPWEPFTGAEQMVRDDLSAVRDGQEARVVEEAP